MQGWTAPFMCECSFEGICQSKPWSAQHISAVCEQGLRGSLEATMHVKGLLEMMFDVLSGWIDEFISDMEERHNAHPRTAPVSALCCVDIVHDEHA